MRLKIRQITLLLLFFAILFGMWYIYPQSSNRTSYKSYRYLSQIRKSGPYIIKRLTNAELDYVPCLLLGNKVDEDAVYLDPNGENIWYLSIDYVKDRESTFYKGPSWIQIDFEGRILQSLPENKQPPSGGIFLKDKLRIKGFDWNDSNGRLWVAYFKRNHFNWNLLNPFKIHDLSDARHKPKCYWNGTAYLRMKMPQGEIDFKVETSNTDGGYKFEAKLFEVPTTFSENQTMILTLTNTGTSGKDKGIYLIYKK
ncbi:MAG: hypothetical protein LBE37_10230 [Sphingobacterium sp.]|jgi:hypothetical protein|nr:hypothetical protein [Sphingobacterium sp.]